MTIDCPPHKEENKAVFVIDSKANLSKTEKASKTITRQVNTYGTKILRKSRESSFVKVLSLKKYPEINKNRGM